MLVLCSCTHQTTTQGEATSPVATIASSATPANAVGDESANPQESTEPNASTEQTESSDLNASGPTASGEPSGGSGLGANDQSPPAQSFSPLPAAELSKIETLPQGPFAGNWLMSTAARQGNPGAPYDILKFADRQGEVRGTTCGGSPRFFVGQRTGYSVSGRTLGADGEPVMLSLDAAGTTLSGTYPGVGKFTGRRMASETACEESPVGGGPTTLVIMMNDTSFYPVTVTTHYPGHTFRTLLPPVLARSDLATADRVFLVGICDADHLFAAWQQSELLQYVASGHVLVMHPSDFCKSFSYSFLPYAFESSAPGASGASGKVLTLVESDALGTNAPQRSDFIDTAAYVAANQQLGDAQVMVTHDGHWCGHLYAKNVAGGEGFVQAYARYGKGLFVFDGLDVDDSFVTQYQQILKLELALTPSADLPCNHTVIAGEATAPPVVTAAFAPTQGTAAAARAVAAATKPRTLEQQLAKVRRVAVYGIHFDFNSAHIQPKSEPVLREIAGILRRNPTWRLSIEGHTDAVGSAAYNLALSQRRAAAVKAALIQRYGIGANRLTDVGYGEARPIATNATTKGRALNRRVELVRI